MNIDDVTPKTKTMINRQMTHAAGLFVIALAAGYVGLWWFAPVVAWLSGAQVGAIGTGLRHHLYDDKKKDEAS